MLSSWALTGWWLAGDHKTQQSFNPICFYRIVAWKQMSSYMFYLKTKPNWYCASHCWHQMGWKRVDSWLAFGVHHTSRCQIAGPWLACLLYGDGYSPFCSSCRKFDLCRICTSLIRVKLRRSLQLMKPSGQNPWTVCSSSSERFFVLLIIGLLPYLCCRTATRKSLGSKSERRLKSKLKLIYGTFLSAIQASLVF